MTVKEAIYELNFVLGEVYDQVFYDDKPYEFDEDEYEALDMAIEALKQTTWIPCSEKLPEDIRPVIVTWKNTDPKSYYQYIVGKHFIGVACFKNGKWYWYSSTTEDMLAEYGRYDFEEFDEAIECIAWMPLPEPMKEEQNDTLHDDNS